MNSLPRRARLGLAIPTCREGLSYPSPFAAAEEIVDLGAEAERWGFDAVWANQHFLTQAVIRAAGVPHPNYFDPMILGAWILARTSRIRVNLATLIGPAWDPLVLAKQIATLDQASGGRVTLGLGGGAYPEEHQTMRAARGSSEPVPTLRDLAGCLRALFGSDPVHYAGQAFHLDGVGFNPKPTQDRLPIHVAANTEPGIRRAGRWADGWIGASLPVSRLVQAKQLLAEGCAEAGRAPSAVAATVQLWVAMGPTESAVRSSTERSQHVVRVAQRRGMTPAEVVQSMSETDLVGDPAQIAARIQQYVDAGADEIGLVPLAETVTELGETAAALAGSVLPAMAPAEEGERMPWHA